MFDDVVAEVDQIIAVGVNILGDIDYWESKNAAVDITVTIIDDGSVWHSLQEVVKIGVVTVGAFHELGLDGGDAAAGRSNEQLVGDHGCNEGGNNNNSGEKAEHGGAIKL